MNIKENKKLKKKNVQHLKTNWLQNFSYIEGNSSSFKGVRALVEADQFSDALKVLDASNYKYSNWSEFQTLRNNLIP